MSMRSSTTVDEIGVVDRGPDFGKIFSNKHHQHVDFSIGQASSVSPGKVGLGDDGEEDENTLIILFHKQQQESRDEIERLTIANARVI